MDELSDSEFDVWLDAMERGEKHPAAFRRTICSVSADDAADLSLARRLLALRAAPSPGLATRVAQIPNAPSTPRLKKSPPHHRPALLGAALVAGLALIFSLVFTPAGTWAQGVLHQLGITFLPGAMPQWSATPPEITPTRSPVAFSSEREVQALAEFPLRWPTRFPFDRDSVTFLGFLAYTQDGAWIESLYGDEEHRYLEVQVFWQRRPGPWPLGEAQLEAISVAGHQGLWGEGVPASFIAGARSTLIHKELNGTETRVGSAEGFSLEPINVLLWEDGEVLYMLVDPNQQFTQADLLQTAESAYDTR